MTYRVYTPNLNALGHRSSAESFRTSGYRIILIAIRTVGNWNRFLTIPFQFCGNSIVGYLRPALPRWVALNAPLGDGHQDSGRVPFRTWNEVLEVNGPSPWQPARNVYLSQGGDSDKMHQRTQGEGPLLGVGPRLVGRQ